MNDWIEWKGGNMPVDGETLVWIKLAMDGPDHRGVGPIPAKLWRWDVFGNGGDIVAYRIHKEA